MKRKDLAKTFILISNKKNFGLRGLYKYFSALRVKCYIKYTAGRLNWVDAHHVK